jgi:hypothetical protein
MLRSTLFRHINFADTSISKSYNFLQLEPNSKIQKDLKSAKFIFSNLKFKIEMYFFFDKFSVYKVKKNANALSELKSFVRFELAYFVQKLQVFKRSKVKIEKS